MNILGLNIYHADASAALLKEGKLVAAGEEERFSRVKHAGGFPERAIRYCLEEGGLEFKDIDHIAVSRNPSRHFLKKAMFALRRMRKLSKTVKERLRNTAKVLDVKDEIRERFSLADGKVRAKTHRVEHHLAHIASSFFLSPFREAALLSIDGFGDFCSTMRGYASGNDIEILDRVIYPHSLGMFYLMVTQHIGFKKFADEGKVMALAPYGRPRYLKEMEEIVKLTRDGLFELDTEYFRHESEGIDMYFGDGPPFVGEVYTSKMAEVFGPPREPGSPIEEKHRDIAASLQAHLERAIFWIVNDLAKKVQTPNLSLAGGVALNCVANGKLRSETPFK